MMTFAVGENERTANRMRLIDADALMEAMYHRAFETDGDTMWQSGCWVRYRAIEQVVKEQPSVEAEPVRHGHWIPKFGGEFKGGAYWYDCSECGHTVAGGILSGNYFCKNCGARMDFEKGEKEQ